jgi:ankyrin repeat protein
LYHQVDVFDRHHLATPLFCAAVSDNPSGIEVLLNAGADINAGLHEYGVSALHCAVRQNAIENVRKLLDLGAVPNNVQEWDSQFLISLKNFL